MKKIMIVTVALLLTLSARAQIASSNINAGVTLISIGATNLPPIYFTNTGARPVRAALYDRADTNLTITVTNNGLAMGPIGSNAVFSTRTWPITPRYGPCVIPPGWWGILALTNSPTLHFRHGVVVNSSGPLQFGFGQ